MLLRAVVLFVLFVAASAVIARAERTVPIPSRQPLSAFPAMLSEWRGLDDPPLTEEVLDVLGADDYLMRTYFTPQRRGAALYIGYWKTQERGDAVHSPLNCIPGAGWQPVSNGYLRVAVPTASGTTSHIEVNRYVIEKGLDRQLVLYWYQSHGRVVASEYWGKFYLVADAVRLGRSDAAIVRVTTPIPGSTAEAEAAAERTALGFVQELYPQLDAYLPS
jgi:EpsI family protein